MRNCVFLHLPIKNYIISLLLLLLLLLLKSTRIYVFAACLSIFLCASLLLRVVRRRHWHPVVGALRVAKRVAYVSDVHVFWRHRRGVLLSQRRDQRCVRIDDIRPPPLAGHLPHSGTVSFPSCCCCPSGVPCSYIISVYFAICSKHQTWTYNTQYSETKAKAYNTCIASQAAYRSCSGAVHVKDRAGVEHRP